MRSSARNTVACWLSALLLAGCAASPEAQFYTLAPLPSTDNNPGIPFPHSLEVRPVTLPELVDRPQLVVGIDAHQVRLLENHRWAEPLKSAIPRIMADNLSRILGTDRVSWYPRAAPAPADYRITVDFQRFESSGSLVILDALWTVRSAAGGAPQTGRSLVRETSVSADHGAIASAYSRALAAVSRDIAVHLRRNAGGPPAPPRQTL
ncbi:PqiC family protein [Trichlorobacter ammonificans]|uniref:ABC_trans_aux domain-containing protein n=1 Tax=Trichlorobacter ammonificans TaxID=2916410 RepID=A0ABM9DCL4_9BACT|nr:PqiC family protein [Trichlorobacter ammonificans]CAH2032074.1 ABC_trans_aux domain-containing protein [Trichlorobacter ammonificans]